MNIRIKTRPEVTPLGESRSFKMWGWYSGKSTYLGFGTHGNCDATISGKKLYRLAKSIVKQFELRQRR